MKVCQATLMHSTNTAYASLSGTLTSKNFEMELKHGVLYITQPSNEKWLSPVCVPVSNLKSYTAAPDTYPIKKAARPASDSGKSE